ncbi:MAG: OsmC family protein [Candidatus Eisenbacteria bacterium]|nr:OsmC family protein [Candidatus Eisenbacteria bacterium]
MKLEGDAIRTLVEGVNEVRDGLPVLTAIRVHYRLKIPAGVRASVDRALARHLERCPTAVSLRGAVDVSWSAEIEETTPAGC